MRYLKLATLMLLGLSFCTSAFASGTCSADAIVGSYVYNYTGLLATNNGMANINSFRPTATAGRIVFNNDLSLTGSQTDNSTGVAFRISYTGTYTLNPDTCSGTMTRTYINGFVVHEDFYMTNDGREIRFVRTFPVEFIVSGTAIRQ